MTAEQIRLAREWLTDCYPDEVDEIMECAPSRIERAVKRDYDGGITQFCLDCQ